MLQVSTFKDLLVAASEQFASQLFFADDEMLHQVTYTDVLHFARGLQRKLDDLGVPEGAAVATVFHNCGLAALMFLGVIASRRLLVPLNPVSTRSEVDFMLEQAGCKLVIFDPTHTRSLDGDNRQHLTITDHCSFCRECRQEGAGLSAGATSQDADASTFVGEVVFTSGSTGRPKGVVLSEQNLLANASALVVAYELNESDRFLTVCPLFHNSGQLFTTLCCVLVGGSTAAVKSDIGMLYFWQHVQKHRAHWSLGMVSFLGLLLSRKDDPESIQMRGLLTGGSSIDAGLVRAFESRFGVPVRTVYGLTESSSIATCEFRDPSPRSLGSSGRPLPSSDVRIARESGELVPPGNPLSREAGEIWIGGPTIFDRYIGERQMTESRKHGSWLKSGDIGYFDENGNLFVVDRLDSMLIVGGENVYPAEVERLCTQLPGAAQIVLAGVDNRIWGKELVLVYKTEIGAVPSPRTWHGILAGQLASCKLPWRYVAIEELGFEDFPRKTNGKLDRQAIAAALQKAKRAGASSVRPPA